MAALSSSTTITGRTTIEPLGPNNRALAGGSFNVLTPGAYNASGLNNVGLLVRAWGKTTFVGTDYFYLDDGSGCQDGSEDSGTPINGVRVVNVTGYKPSVGDYISLTGISGLATYVSNYARTIRLAKPSDLLSVSPPLPPSDLSASATGASLVPPYDNNASKDLPSPRFLTIIYSSDFILPRCCSSPRVLMYSVHSARLASLRLAAK